MSEIPPSVPTSKNSGLAIGSLVLGILAMVVCIASPLFGIPAIILGHMARSRIKKSGGLLKGQGMAAGGLVMGYLSLVFLLIGVILVMLGAVAMPSFVKARDTAMQNICSQNIDLIDTGKALWASDTGNTNGTPTAVELDKYIAGGFGSLKCPKGGQYSINPIDTLPTCSEPSHNKAR